MGLLLGRSSVSLQGITVLPGVVDADYTGEIQFIIAPPVKAVKIQSGQRIAQLLLFPLVGLSNPTVTNSPRGDGGFGSSDATYLLQEIKAQRPLKVLKIQGKPMEGLLDTGADVSCIAGKDWPTSWPIQETASNLIGLGSAKNVLKSSSILTWEDPDGGTGHFNPYVIPSLPFSLWGRDILSQMGVLLYSPNDQVTAQMLDMGYVPGTGLGSKGQGRVSPISPKPNVNNAGLGYEDFSKGPLHKRQPIP